MKRVRNPRSEPSPDMAAFDRLYQDGAHSVAAVRRRVALFAAERQLDAAETKALLKGRLTVRHIGPFIEKYHLSADWLLAGDLKGRLRMARKDLPRSTSRQCVWPNRSRPLSCNREQSTLC